MVRKLPYAQFLTYPEGVRREHSIANDWHDENGERWVAIFKWQTSQRRREEKESPTTLFLDFYNLDAKDTEACLNFIAQHSITYVAESCFDDSKAFRFTVGDLLLHHEDYRTDFDWLMDEKAFHQAINREIQTKRPGKKGYYVDDPPSICQMRINENLSRCHPHYGGPGDYYYQNQTCTDFLALCYLQLLNADKKKIRTCPVCDRRSLPLGKGKPPKYCKPCREERYKPEYNKLYMKYIKRPSDKGQSKKSTGWIEQEALKRLRDAE